MRKYFTKIPSKIRSENRDDSYYILNSEFRSLSQIGSIIYFLDIATEGLELLNTSSPIYISTATYLDYTVNTLQTVNSLLALKMEHNL